MLNINESMWSRDSATTTTMAKTPNAWGNATTEMAIPRRGQFSTANSNNVDPSNPGSAINTNGVASTVSSGHTATAPVVGVGPEGPGVPGGPAGGRLKFMFSPEDMTESVLFGGPSQKIGLEDAMERLNMVSYNTVK